MLPMVTLMFLGDLKGRISGEFGLKEAPANIAVIPNNAGKFLIPKLAKEEPGHWPDIPQPMQNITAPRIERAM